MAELKIYNMEGKSAGNITLQDAVFGAEYNEALIHQVVVAQLANKRQGTKSTLTRSEVRGGGIKPWRQKGTGRARQGSIRAPQWIKGGVVFAPKPRDFSQKINKKMKDTAFKSAISKKLIDNQLVAIKELKFTELKTKNMAEVLDKLMPVLKKDIVVKNEKPVAKNAASKNVADKTAASKYVKPVKKQPSMSNVLIITSGKDDDVLRVASNISNVQVTFVDVLSVYDVVSSQKILATTDALKKLEEVYA